jgi:glucose/arabinose dehydrogenase
MISGIRAAALAALFAPWTATAQTNGADMARVVSAKAAQVNVQSLVRLDNPWGMTFLPDGRLLITEKPGRLRVYDDGKLSEPIGGVPRVAYHGQGGLLDVEIDPNFSWNGLVYLSYAEPAKQQPKDARLDPDPRLGELSDTTDKVVKGGAVARAKLEGGQLRDLKVIWRQVPKTVGLGHFGGRLVFAPDGKLFITSGERQRFEPAQDLRSNLGKIVRVSPDGSIPKDNPFVGRPGARPDIWTLGHRNPLGAAINPSSRKLWIHEMGPAHGDEVNIIERGNNYGWPVVSNGDHYDGTPIPDHPTRPEFEPPIHFWNPAVSPSGLVFYAGDRFPSWRGNALLGGLTAKALIRLTLEGDRVTGEERIDLGKRIRDVTQAPDGAVLLLVDGDQGELLRLTRVEQATR